MNSKSEPYLAHSELTDCIYIISGNNKYEVTEQCIKAMEVTNRIPAWIPCSERLPDEGEWLVCFDDGYITTVNYCMVVDRMDWELWLDAGEPIAWMPLPEPYKAESEG